MECNKRLKRTPRETDEKDTSNNSNNVQQASDPTNDVSQPERTSSTCTTPPNPSIEELVNACQALINGNKRTWARCKPYCCQYLKMEDRPGVEECLFYRVRSHVLAYTETARFHPVCSHNELVVELGPAISKRIFFTPISRPAKLEQLVGTLANIKDDIMPDFGFLLKQSMLLSDDIVPKFLRGFKSFLKRQNLVLAAVEEWIFEDKDDSCFTLEEEYGIPISWNLAGLYKINVRNDARALSECHGYCFYCGRHYLEHTKESCGIDWVYCASDDTEKACFPLLNGDSKELFRCAFPGDLEFRVSVESKKEREWLIKFLNFVGYKKTRPVRQTLQFDDDEDDKTDKGDY